MSTFDFDLFVIGAGSGGVRLARMSAAKGKRVAVAESRYLGGTCVNVGCVPKKLFVYASEFPEHREDSVGFGWSENGEANFDWPTLVANKDAEIKRLNGIYDKLLVNSGAEIIHGHARFVDGNTVEVEGKAYTAERIVIATGSWPYIPDFKGNEHAITSNEFFYLDALPEKAIVLGGGYIAIEMAGILNGLGVETTLVYRGELFLRGFDEEIREFVRKEVQKKGIDLKFNTNIEAIEKFEGQYQVKLTSGEILESGLVLAATGRVPLTEGLALENTKVELDKRGQIIVNEHFESKHPGIFALGDVTGGMQLTPVALAEGMYLSEYLFGENGTPKLVDYENIPTAVFCQPNIATVGLSEEQAKDKFGDIDVYVSEFRALKNTMSGNEGRTLMKLIVNKADNVVLGAHMVGHDAGEIIQGLGIAIKAGATKEHFDQTIGIHPTSAEEFVTMRQARS